jgi:hypothetical protein
MRQFLLVVRTGSDPHRRGWLLPHVSDSPVRFQVAADQAARKHVGDSRNRGGD